jgi:hypothetical protein
MKCGSQIAVAVVGGYVLGRSRKTRMAILLALMAAGGGKLPIGPEDLLKKTPLGGSLDKLTGDLRSQLVDAGVNVAKKAASGRIDSLSDRLQERAETLRGTDTKGREAPEEAEEEAERARPRRERGEPSRRRREEPGRRERDRGEPSRRTREPEYDEDEYDDEYDDYDRDDDRDEYEDDYDREDDGPEDEEPEPEPEPEPVRRRRPPARSSRPEPRRRAPRREEEERPRRGRSTR